MNDSPSIVEQLRCLTHDLLWISEIDAPFEVVEWQGQNCPLNQEQVLLFTQHSTDTPIKSMDVDQFFEAAVAEQDWFGDEEKVTAEQYRELVSTLKQNLRELKVYQVGEVTIDIYIVGEIDSKTIICLATKAVET